MRFLPASVLRSIVIEHFVEATFVEQHSYPYSRMLRKILIRRRNSIELSLVVDQNKTVPYG
jgi:hypothetical protein